MRPIQAQEVSTLQTQNAALLQRVSELEAQNDNLLGGDRIPLSVLERQICNLVSSSTLLSHGPDSPERLEGFTLDAFMREVKSLAPDLLHLFNTLGETRRNTGDEEEGMMTEEIKVLCSLCTLINARSRRVKYKMLQQLGHCCMGNLYYTVVYT